MLKFSESISYDQRLYKHDINGSVAHAQMLAKTGLITAEDCQQIEQGLQAIRHEIDIFEPYDLTITKQRERLHRAGKAIDRIFHLGDIACAAIDDFHREIVGNVLCLLREPLLAPLRNKVIVVAADKCEGFR